MSGHTDDWRRFWGEKIPKLTHVFIVDHQRLVEELAKKKGIAIKSGLTSDTELGRMREIVLHKITPAVEQLEAKLGIKIPEDRPGWHGVETEEGKVRWELSRLCDRIHEIERRM